MPDPQNITRLQVQVRPNAPKNEITSYIDGWLHIKIAAPPLKGKANKELVAFLSRKLGIAKSNVNVIKGQTARKKLITVDSLSHEDTLKALLPPQSGKLL